MSLIVRPYKIVGLYAGRTSGTERDIAHLDSRGRLEVRAYFFTNGAMMPGWLYLELYPRPRAYWQLQRKSVKRREFTGAISTFSIRDPKKSSEKGVDSYLFQVIDGADEGGPFQIAVAKVDVQVVRQVLASVR